MNVVPSMRAAASRLLRPATAATAMRASATCVGNVRHFSGNVEYPRIEGSVLEVSGTLNSIGARLSIPTAALYLTKQKIEYVVRGLKTPEELREVQRVLLLCDAKFVYPSDFAIGSFISAAIKLGHADVALAFIRDAKHMRHYVQNQSFVRLATYYADKEDDNEVVAEIAKIVDASGVTKTHKWYGFQIAHAKKQNDLETAIAIAKQAAAEKQINSHVVLTLLEGLEGEALAEQLPLAKYLVAKGDVFVNAKLDAILQGL